MHRAHGPAVQGVRAGFDAYFAARRVDDEPRVGTAADCGGPGEGDRGRDLVLGLRQAQGVEHRARARHGDAGHEADQCADHHEFHKRETAAVPDVESLHGGEVLGTRGPQHA